MTHDPRPEIQRRRSATGRLRSLTAGATIAGLAGTAAFAAIAAASWSGDPAASGTEAGRTPIEDANDVPAIRPQATPATGGSGQQPTTIAPRVQRGSGPGHASSGGSN